MSLSLFSARNSSQQSARPALLGTTVARSWTRAPSPERRGQRSRGGQPGDMAQTSTTLPVPNVFVKKPTPVSVELGGRNSWMSRRFSNIPRGSSVRASLARPVRTSRNSLRAAFAVVNRQPASTFSSGATGAAVPPSTEFPKRPQQKCTWRVARRARVDTRRRHDALNHVTT